MSEQPTRDEGGAPELGQGEPAGIDRPTPRPDPEAGGADAAGPAVLLPDGTPARPAAPPSVQIAVHPLGNVGRVDLGNGTVIEGTPEDLVAIIRFLSQAAVMCFERRMAVMQKLQADQAARAAAVSAKP